MKAAAGVAAVKEDLALRSLDLAHAARETRDVAARQAVEERSLAEQPAQSLELVGGRGVVLCRWRLGAAQVVTSGGGVSA